MVPSSAEPEPTPAPSCNDTWAGSCPWSTTNRVSPAACRSPLQVPSVPVFVLLLGPVTPAQAAPLLEGPRSLSPRLRTAGYLRAATGDRARFQQGGGSVAHPPPKSIGTPLRVCPVPIGTHSPGPPRPQPGPTNTASPPDVTSCSDSCCQAGPTPTNSCHGPRRAPGPGRSCCVRPAQAPFGTTEISPHAPDRSSRPRPWPGRAGHLSSSSPPPTARTLAGAGNVPSLRLAATGATRHPQRPPRPTPLDRAPGVTVFEAAELAEPKDGRTLAELRRLPHNPTLSCGLRPYFRTHWGSNRCLITGGDKLAVLGRRWGSKKKAREERGGSVRAGRGLGVVRQRWIQPKDIGKKAPVAQPRRERCWNHTGVWPRQASRPRRSWGDTGDTR
ncbi:hypothetical protein NDU88_003573 [Pleurodeles waltl]|uniref:Uncharacterized protein n=1 Tax=Pleurodeles waltl TaxID=8319 RepID=A0AAV7WSQ3_PLEWA|nr:hypothetical protein NDU88_003573 [Pleurodeles waltl]